MEFRSVIDLAALAEHLDVPQGFMEVGDKRIPMRQWTPDKLASVADIARQSVIPGEPLAITGVAPSWVLGTITAAVYPERTMFYVPAVDMAFNVERLPAGDIAPEGEIRFTVTEHPGAAAVDFMSDDPSKPFDHGPHNYDYANITRVRIPKVSPGTRVLLSGRGAFPVALSIETGYIALGCSVWMRYQNETAYTCVRPDAGSALGDRLTIQQ